MVKTFLYLQQMGLTFEVENLAVASPDIVSRTGMVNLDINDLEGDQTLFENGLPLAQYGVNRDIDLIFPSVNKFYINSDKRNGFHGMKNWELINRNLEIKNYLFLQQIE